MVEIELKSKDLTEFVYLILNKDRKTPIYDEDVKKIKDVTIDALDLVEEPTDETIYDLIFFTKLESCIIANMVITDNEIELLNKLTSIESIQFYRCVFPKGKKLNMQASTIIIDQCSEFDSNIFDESPNVKCLQIINCKNINLSGIDRLSEITQLFMHNLDLDNIDVVENLKKLEYLNLNGSKIKKISNVLNNPNVKIEHEEFYYIYDV